jgi:luciferase family oxidoreductase group 1
MKLSILDQAPISAGETAQQALQSSIDLAQHGESLGYHRFWIAEHHDLFGLACPNPSVMLGVIGSRTKLIRIGAGAVLLPYYKPFHVAETYHLLATLFPKRIDLGLGRAPGGSAEVSLALSDNYLEKAKHFPEDIKELLHYFDQGQQLNGDGGKISPSPVPIVPPQPWILGTSEKSAFLAASLGLPYAFGCFMTDFDGRKIVQTYRERFIKKRAKRAYVIVAVHVICAETTEKANQLALSSIVWRLLQEKPGYDGYVPTIETAKKYDFSAEEIKKVGNLRDKIVIGNPEDVKKQLEQLQQQFAADELMIMTVTHEKKTRFTSYQLLMEQFRQDDPF